MKKEEIKIAFVCVENARRSQRPRVLLKLSEKGIQMFKVKALLEDID
jgi:protein-tyrosine-phosphatase